MSHKSFRQALFSVRTFCSSAVNGAFPFSCFFGLEFPRDFSEMCFFIVKSTGQEKGFWPVHFPSCPHLLIPDPANINQAYQILQK